MSYAVKLAAILAAFCLALAAFVHAASENGRVIFSPGSLGRSGLDAHVVGEIVDGAFRAETVSLQTQTLSEGQANLTSEEVAALSADPAALESLLEARRRMASQNGSNEYPRLSGDLLALARLSYAVDPLNVRTVRSIALGNVLHVDAERARQLLQNASALSKRDEIVNLWLAQDYGRQGDVPRMLASFDHALRTSRRARESAISPLVALLSSAESQVMVGQLLRQQPQWEN